MAMSNAVEMAAMRQRFPKLPPLTAAFQGFTIVATNAYLLYLLLRGEVTPTALAAYGVLELVGWSVIANTALIPVPKNLRVGSPDMPLVSRILAIVAVSVFLGGIAWMTVPDRADAERLLHTRDPLAALGELNILLPLSISIGLAAFGSLGDLLRWRRSGGPFVTGTAMAAAAKILTAIVAPTVAAVMSGSSADPVHKALVWSYIYLAIKCAAELLMLVWQSIGMPERPQSRARSHAGP